jgi:hypothetical protein
MLTRISTQDVEPARDLNISLAPRLNLLCGDNGLGKTFLLDLAWWALTETWAQHPVMPKLGHGVQPAIRCEFDEPPSDISPHGVVPLEAHFSFDEQRWISGGGLGRRFVIYARADGGFDVWDSFRTPGSRETPSTLMAIVASRRFTFEPQMVWDGLSAEDGTVRCNGLIRDWVSWQFQRPELFALFTRVLAKLSPHPDEVIRPGPPRRISIEDARDIPTLELAYGNVPVTHASAGIRRILSLAYILVWSFHEHAEAARLRNIAPLGELLLLIDEVDAHLHPRWQRVLLPSLFEVIPEIQASLKVQVLASTHAPLVLASVETIFDQERDKLIHFDIEGGAIVVDEIPWAKQGDAENWLVSEAFGLRQARSQPAERAIEAAQAFMRGAPLPPDLDTQVKIHQELLRVLPGHDDFWARWLVETGVVK